MSELALGLAWIGALLGPLLAWAIWRRWRTRWTGPALLVLLAVFYPLGVWTFLVEPQTLTVRRIEVASERWRGPPLRIGVISDIHAGAPYGDLARIKRTVARMNAERPDVVVLLGDYAGGHAAAARRSAGANAAVIDGTRALAGLRAPQGVYAVLGNHDWWYGAPRLESVLRRNGATLLENRAAEVRRPGGGYWIAGLADVLSRRKLPSVRRAFAEVPAGAPVILLTHWPDPFDEEPGRAALTLAGHTHCGQVNLPIVGRLVNASRRSRDWACGLYHVGGRKLFVTSGVGTSILPVRFRAPPEIAVVTLRAAGPAEGP